MVDGRTDELTELSVPQNVRLLLQQTESYRATLERQGHALFYQGEQGLARYTKHLVGWPFVVTGEPIYRTLEKSEKRTFAGEVVQFPIRVVNVESDTLNAPELAMLSGAYLLNQVRSMTLRELTGYVWTVAENGLFDIPKQTDGRSHPYMLKIFEQGTDSPPSEGDALIVTNAYVYGALVPETTKRHIPDGKYTTTPASAESQTSWQEFNQFLRSRGLVLSDARVLLEMADDESWMGRNGAEDMRVLEALLSAPEDSSPQEQLVKRGRGRPPKTASTRQPEDVF
jgi:hypothetical protein